MAFSSMYSGSWFALVLTYTRLLLLILTALSLAVLLLASRAARNDAHRFLTLRLAITLVVGVVTLLLPVWYLPLFGISIK